MRRSCFWAETSGEKDLDCTCENAIAASTTNSAMGDDNNNFDDYTSDRKPLEIVTISVLREYLAWEFRNDAFSSPLPFAYDFERIVDDFVFICFFVGNDFLPHLPSLDIREGALDLLMDLYRQRLPALGG